MSDTKKQKENTISRRTFFSLLGVTPFAFNSLLAKDNFLKYNIQNFDFFKQMQNINSTLNNPTNNPILNDTDLIIPPVLKEGDTVAFTAPASPINIASIKTCIDFFSSKNCKIIIGDTISKNKNENRYFSAPDLVRANELNSLFANPEIKAIICGRGGYGVMRILPYLDYKIIRQNPKIVMGYSDITALLLAMQSKSKVVAFHGPVGASKITDVHKINMTNILFNSQNSNVKYYVPDMQAITKGVARGKLQGGNMTLISATMGTDYEINLDNAILFIEDVSILAHDFDRMLTQLLISNKLANCKGIIIGKMKNFEKRGDFYPNRAYTILEITEQLIKPLGIPCVYDLPFGHVESSLIFPLGMEAELNIDQKTIEIFYS